MQQRRNQNSRQSYPLPWSNTETLELQTPTEQCDEPEHGDEAKRELCSQPEIVAGLLGSCVGWIGRMKLRPVKEYQPALPDPRLGYYVSPALKHFVCSTRRSALRTKLEGHLPRQHRVLRS